MTYLLTGIDPAKWKTFRLTCIKNDTSMKAVILELIELYCLQSEKEEGQ